MKNRFSRQTPQEMVKSGIAFLLAAIDITLVEGMSRIFHEINMVIGYQNPETLPAGTVILFAACWLAGVFLFYRLIRSLFRQKDRRLIRHAAVWGILLAVSYVLGCRLRIEGTVFGRAGRELVSFAKTACLSVLAAACVAQILRKWGSPRSKSREVNSAGIKASGITSLRSKSREVNSAGIYFLYMAVILLCWLPVFLAYYPSVFAYDAEGQLYQVIAGDYSTHHPLLHTLFLGAFFRLGGVWGSYSAGMAIHSLVQMLLMAAAFAWTLFYLYRKQVPRYLRVFLLLFYALFPANSVLALSTTKDVLFSALVLLHTITLYRMVCDRRWRAGKRDWAVYVVLAVLMLLMRNNAVYAFAVSVPALVLLAARCRTVSGAEADRAVSDTEADRTVSDTEADRTVSDAETNRARYDEKMSGTGRNAGGAKSYFLVSLTILALFAVCSAGLKAVTHAQNGSPREMLSVPLQQMARVRVEREEEIAPVLRDRLDQYIPSEWVFAAYNPHLADPVKNRAVIHDDPVGLMKTWVKLGVSYPDIYIDAFLDNSVGCWFLEDTSHAQIYGIGTESGFGYLSTDNRVMPAGCEIVEHSYLPGLRKVMEKIVSDNVYQRLPVVRMLFAPALYWWLLCMYMAAAVYRRRYEALLPVLFLVVYYLTLLLSPTVLVRYMYPFMVTVPAICCCLYGDLTGNDSENIQ